MAATSLGDLAGQPLVLAASSGGHLAQLSRIARRIGAHEGSLWVTSDDEHSRSLLRGRDVFFVPYVYPRDVWGAVRAARLIRSRLAERAGQYTGVVSTGAAVAVSAFAAGRQLGLPGVYVESVSRTRGPSLTGRLVQRFRLATPLTQHPSWAGGRWGTADSVLGDFYPTSSPCRRERPSIFVSLGTIRPFRFDRLLDAVLSSGLADERTVWQTGATPRTDLPGIVRSWMTVDEFRHHARNSDLVIAHAGVGTVLDLLEMGIRPVVLPRMAAYQEHVDDHQCQISQFLADRDLAHVLHLEQGIVRQLIEATERHVTPA